jgi:phenylalanyl-tRNA synthetase beta chain
VLRQHLVGSLLDVLALNERSGREDVAIFEIGKGYGRVGDTPREWTRLALLLSGNAAPPAWNRIARGYDLDDAKGIAELLCARLDLPVPAYTADTRGYPFHPGRALAATSKSAIEMVGGRLAELHPDVLAAWEIRAGRVVVAELAIRDLEAGSRRPVHVDPIGRFPVMERDLAVIVLESRAAATVQAAIRRHAGDLLLEERLFDLYRGAPLAADEKSLAYRLVFGTKDRTLTESEVDAAMTAVRDGLAADLGAHIRS